MRVHVSIVYNSNIELMTACLNSLVHQNYKIEVTIVNNIPYNSYDIEHILNGYYKKFSSFNIINNIVPAGFSFNHNKVLRDLSFDVKYALILNDDVIMHSDALIELIRLMDSDDRIGVTAPLLFYPDGTPQRNSSYFPTNLHGILLALSGKKIPVSPHARQGTFWLRGVCLMLRLEALRDVGYLDESFDPGYGEDIDLCYRLHKRGWLLRICPEARVVHFEGQSFGKGTVNWYRQSFRGLFRFLSRTRSPAEWRVLKTAWIIGLSLRWAASVALRAVGVRNRLGPPIAYRLVLADLLHTTSASTAGRSR